MSTRLQVLMDDREIREIRRLARQQKVTVAQWVRTALRDAARNRSSVDPKRKLAALRSAARFSFPTGDIDQVLAEVERGYGSATEE